MPDLHVYLDTDFQDRSGFWVRSFSQNNIQFHTKACGTYEAMIGRCQDGGLYKQRFTTYESVNSEFEGFHHFAEWCQTQNGYHGHDGNKRWCLDKDILVRGNKTYSPETCAFIPEFVNTLFVNKKATALPLGVTRHLSKFRARCSTLDGRIHLGCFTTPMEAHKAWQISKADHIFKISQIYSQLPEKDHNVTEALLLRYDLIREEVRVGKETLII